MQTRQSILAVTVALLAAPALRADEAEDRAVKAIEKLGGKVTRDDKREGKPVTIVQGTRASERVIQRSPE